MFGWCDRYVTDAFFCFFSLAHFMHFSVVFSACECARCNSVPSASHIKSAHIYATCLHHSSWPRSTILLSSDYDEPSARSLCTRSCQLKNKNRLIVICAFADIFHSRPFSGVWCARCASHSPSPSSYVLSTFAAIFKTEPD